MALLNALMSLPAFGKDKSLYDRMQGLDRLVAEYQKASGLSVPDEVSLSVLACAHKATHPTVFGPVSNLCHISNFTYPF